MNQKTKELAILAVTKMREGYKSKANSLGHNIEYKKSVVVRASSAGSITRAKNELAELEKDLAMATERLVETNAALADLEAM